MKYKSSEIELPPLGEIVVLKKEKIIAIGEFYINANKVRMFNSRLSLNNYFCESPSSYKWSFLPKFKSVKKEMPPIGINILIACNDGSVEEGLYCNFYINYFIKGQSRVIACKHWNAEEIEIDSWLPLDTFDEE